MKYASALLLIFLLLSVPNVDAQSEEPSPTTTSASLADPDEDPFGKPVVNIIFDGIKNVALSDVESVVRPFKGKGLATDTPAAIQKKLEGTGYFYQVSIYVDSVSSAGVTLSIQVKERPVIAGMLFNGNKKMRVRDLSGKVDIKRGRPFNPESITTAEEALKAAYKENGYIQAEVKGSYTQDADGLVTIEFDIKEGLPQIVRAIDVSGIDALTVGEGNENRKKEMMKTFAQKTQGFARKGIYKEELVAQDRASVENFMKGHGFIDAKVSDVTIDRSVDTEDGAIKLDIVYMVDAGDSWKYGGVAITGNKIYSNEELMKSFADLKEGVTFDYGAFQRDYVMGLQGLYGDNGYIFNKYDLQENRDAATKTISYEITITEYDRAHVESIKISGNTKTKPFVINRQIPFEEGEVFSSSKLRQAYNNLMSTGFFAGVNPDVQEGSQPGLVNVSFGVEEGKTTQLMLGLSVGDMSGDFPVSGVFSYGDSNFLGYGYNAKAELSLNTGQVRTSLSFYNPYFLDSKFGLGLSLSYSWLKDRTPQDVMFPIFDGTDIPDPYTGAYVFTSNVTYNGVSYRAGDFFPGDPSESEINSHGLLKDYQYFGVDDAFSMDYESHAINLGVSSGYVLPIFLGYLRFNAGFDMGFSYIYYDDGAVRPAYQEIREGYKTWRFNDGLWFKAAWDARDNPTLPNKGFVLSQYFYLSGGALGGYRTYLKSQTRFDYYFSFPEVVFTKSWSMKWLLKVHTAFSWSGSQFGLPIRDALESHYTLDGMFLGRGWSDYNSTGRVLWDNTVQFSLPLVMSILWWDSFVDLIVLWPDEKALSMPKLWYNNFYGAVGTGFRVSIASFPLSIYLVKRFKVNPPGSPGGAINWNPGRSPTFQAPGLDLAICFSIDTY